MIEYRLPKAVRVKTPSGRFEAPVLGIVGNGVWVESDKALAFRTAVELDLLPDQGPALSVKAEVVSSTGTGLGFEVVNDTLPEMLEVLAAWALGKHANVKEAVGAKADRLGAGTVSSARTPFQPLAGVRVLVVEDDESLAMMLLLALKKRGAVTTVAKDGAAALPLLSKGFDVVLLDWMLPHVSGDVVLAKIRADYPKLPVAVVSGAANTAPTRASMVNLGARTVFTKPFGVRNILDWVERAASDPSEA